MSKNVANRHIQQENLVKRESWWKRKSVRTITLRAIYYAIVLIGVIILLIPILWSISVAFKEASDIVTFPPHLIPQPIVWKNFIYAFTKAHLGTPMINSSIIVCASIVGRVLSCSLIAYGFARLRFPGRDLLFIIVLSTMMLPFYVVMIPQFVIFRYLGWIDTWKPLIAPSFFGNAFFIFLLRQFFMTIPSELDDAARIDGCSTWGIYWKMIMPLSIPALAVVAIYTFTGQWVNLIGPLIYLNSREKWTVSLLLASLNIPHTTGLAWNIVMMSSLISIIPLVIVFFFLQKLFIQGIVITGVKG